MSKYVITDYSRNDAYLAERRAIQLEYPGKQNRKRRTNKNRKLRRKYGVYKGSAAKVRFWYLYAILCEDSTYYIGLTAYKDALQRYQQHVDGVGAKWTKLHKPVKLLEVRPLGSMIKVKAEELEQEMTIEYMRKYSMESVRGGKLCMVSEKLIMRHYNKVSPVKVTKPAQKVGRTKSVYIPPHIRAIMNED